MNDHIAKPINVRDMFTTMARWITPSTAVVDSVQADAGGDDGPEEVIPEMDGLDLSAGLRSTRGNRRLYAKLLRMFRDEQRDFVRRFGAYEHAGDSESMVRAAHTLKGVAGSIGAVAVSEAAKALEFTCREQPAGKDISELLSHVNDALSPLLGELEKIGEAKRAAAAHPGEVKPEELRPLLERLRSHLVASDSDALELAGELEERLRGTEHESDASRLEKLVDNFDFEEAQAALGFLAARLAVELH